MFRKRRGEAGPTGVLVVIIILTASIVLASGVVLYGTTLFQGGAQQEAITVSGIKMWVHGTAADGLSWGAFAVRNTGDKVLSVDKIQVRGTDVPFTQWYPDTDVTSGILQQPMNFTGWSGVGGALSNTGSANCSPATTMEIVLYTPATASEGWFCANQGNGPVGLDPGGGAIIYFKLTNGTLTSVDGGATTSVSVFAGKVGAPQSISISSKT